VVGDSNPASILSKVVLPHPDAPSSEKNSPRLIVRSMLSTATTEPKCFDTLVSLIKASSVLMDHNPLLEAPSMPRRLSHCEKTTTMKETTRMIAPSASTPGNFCGKRNWL